MFFLFVYLFHFRLRPLDVAVMKQLDKCVNVIPVIAKADTLTLEEREAFKKRVGIYRSMIISFFLKTLEYISLRFLFPN